MCDSQTTLRHLPGHALSIHSGVHSSKALVPMENSAAAKLHHGKKHHVLGPLPAPWQKGRCPFVPLFAVLVAASGKRVLGEVSELPCQTLLWHVCYQVMWSVPHMGHISKTCMCSSMLTVPLLPFREPIFLLVEFPGTCTWPTPSPPQPLCIFLGLDPGCPGLHQSRGKDLI